MSQSEEQYTSEMEQKEDTTYNSSEPCAEHADEDAATNEPKKVEENAEDEGKMEIYKGELVSENELHEGDYVAFELFVPNLSWSTHVGKVLKHISSSVVRLACYLPINEHSLIRDPLSEEHLKQYAESNDKMQLWNDREAIRLEQERIVAENSEHSKRLYIARVQTRQRRVDAEEETAQAIEQLDFARVGVKSIQPRQWREARSRVDLPNDMIRLLNAVMLVLHEDKCDTLESIQGIMRHKSFMERLLNWDCTETPMSEVRRRKIVALCSPIPKMHAKKIILPVGELRVPDYGEEVHIFGALDVALRTWINAQIVCSHVIHKREQVANECFNELQEQRQQLVEVNDLRILISRFDVEMHEARQAILGIDEDVDANQDEGKLAEPKGEEEQQLEDEREDAGAEPAYLKQLQVQSLESYPTDTLYYRYVHQTPSDTFPEQVLCTRSHILLNFGKSVAEDTEGYVRLTEEQTNALRKVVMKANINHDADEMEELESALPRDKLELNELLSREGVLKQRPHHTPEDLEELEQLRQLIEDAEWRLRKEETRLADLNYMGRGARHIIIAEKRNDSKYTRLHLKLSGEWESIVEDNDRLGKLREALCNDLTNLLNIPIENIINIDVRMGSLLVDFTVRHSGDVEDKELQELINHCDFKNLCQFYENVTFKKAYPLNSPEQESGYRRSLARERVPVSGMGMKQTLEDFGDDTVDIYGPEITNHPDYRKSFITIPIVCEDYDESAVILQKEFYSTFEELPEVAVKESEAKVEKEVQFEINPTKSLTNTNTTTTTNMNTSTQLEGTNNNNTPGLTQTEVCLEANTQELTNAGEPTPVQVASANHVEQEPCEPALGTDVETNIVTSDANQVHVDPTQEIVNTQEESMQSEQEHKEEEEEEVEVEEEREAKEDSDAPPRILTPPIIDDENKLQPVAV